MSVVLAYSNLLQLADLAIVNGQLSQDDGLETAVLISIFTDRRLEDDDEDPGATYRGGCWQDTYLGEKFGSRLWKLRNKVATQANLNLAKSYIAEALQWFVDDGVASKVEVTTERGSTLNALYFTVNIYKPGDTSPWSQTWELRLNEL